MDTGRGRGGLAQLALKNIAVGQARVKTKSPRIQAQILTFQTCKILWINTYMPCDPQLQLYDDTELLTTLNEIEEIITQSRNCDVIWAADMNWDTKRDNHFTRTLENFMKQIGVISIWEKHNID